MAINPPEGVADFLGFVTGMEWPEADEDLMRRVSEHYGSIARDLETLSGYVVELIPIVKNDFDGEAANSFLMAMNDLTGQTAGANQLGQTADLSRQLSEVALKVANQVEYMKIMAILQLVQLLAEILFATLFSVFTFGSVWGPVSAMFAATREGIHQLFRWLLQTILSQTFIGITGGIFQDTVIQLYQLGAGHTTSWNTESLIDSIKQGALTGLVGGPLEVIFHYGGKLLGRLLGGRTPGSIISKRLDDVLNKADDKLGDVPKNKTPDVPTGGAGPKSKLDDIGAKADKDLPPLPVNRTDGATPPPVPPKTRTEGATPAPAPGKPKPETPGSATAKDKPNAPATGTKGAPAAGSPTGKTDTPATGKKDAPTTGRTDAPATGKKDTPTTDKADAPATGKKDTPTTDKADAPTTGKKDTPTTDKADAPTTGKTETVGGKDAPGAGKSSVGDAPSAGAPAKSTAGDAPATGTASKSSGSSTAGRTAGDTENPLDGLLATKEARSEFAKDVGELLGGVSRQLETGFLRFGEGTIADTFAEKMGKVFADHLKHEGAEQAGKEFGEVLARKWVRLGADHSELPGLLTKAMGDLGGLAPLKSLADSMPDLFARSQHSNALARVFKQENPLQGSPMYQLGGAVASILSEGTHEMLSEGFYNLIFGDGTFQVTWGPFAAGVAMGALSHGLHRMFEPAMVKYQNWVLSHQHAENLDDNKYFGLLHPINIASFVANMTGNPAPWPVPRPTAETQDASFTRDMKDMVKWVFSNPFTGTPFFSDTPGQPDVRVESDGDDAFVPLDLDLGPSFAEDIAKDPLFRTESDSDTSTDDATSTEGGKGGEEGSETGAAASRLTVSSDLSSLLGSNDTETPAPNRADEDRATARPVTQSGGDRFAAPAPQDTESPAEAQAQSQAQSPNQDRNRTSAASSATPHPLQAEKDRAAAEGLDYLLFDVDDDTDIPSRGATTAPPLDGGDHDNGGDGDGTTSPDGPVRDIPSGIAVGVLTPAQTTALQALPHRPGVFVVGMHTDPRTPHDPDLALKALTDAHDDGRLDDVTEIRFTACNLASPVHEATVKTVMSGLWKHRATQRAAADGDPTADGKAAPDPLTARAADAPVWYVPTTGGDTTDVHLFTAQHIGLTPDGKIAVVDEGAWHDYGDGGPPDHTPVRTTPDAAALPDDAVRFLFRTPAVDAEHPDAVKFGPALPPPGDNGEGSSSHAASRASTSTSSSSSSSSAPNQAPPDGHALDSAPDASIDDLVLIRYREESEAYERRLADYLLRLPPVREVAELLARTVLAKLRDTPLYGGLGNDSVSTPGAVGTDPREWERVGANGNTREHMALFFNSLSSKALTKRLGVRPAYPPSVEAEREQREANPDLTEHSTLKKRLRQLDADGQRNSPEHALLNERWEALDSVLRPFRAEQVKPALSTTEQNRAVDHRGKMRWIPGGSSFRIRMDQPFQRGAEQAGRLVRSGTSGSAYYFHRYAQLMADRWRIPVDHRALRLAIIATFVGQGHHSLPEVLAGSAAFAETHGNEYPNRVDIQALRVPVREPAPDWDHYRTLVPLSEERLRRDVARNHEFPHEIAERYRSELLTARQAGGLSDVLGSMDLDDGTPPSDTNAPTSSKRSHPGGDDRESKRERQDGSPGVPEDSPHTLPGERQPEEVFPSDRPIASDRWSAWSWTPGRQDVPPPARVRTERFDPAADPDVTGPFPGTADRRNDDGTLAGRRTLISADVQRFNMPDGDGTPGGTVRLVRVTLPVAVDDSYSAADADALRDRLQGLLDAHVNLGFRLPRTRDQLHMEVRLDATPAPRDGERGDDRITVSRDAGPGVRSDQLHFRLHADDADPDVRSRDDAMLLHELLHYAGLPDRYHDAATLFRHTPARADASGVMATAELPDGSLPLHYLEAIEDVTESGSVLHDNNGPGTWSAPPGPVRDIPAGIAVGVLSAAQNRALDSVPPQAGMFVVGMHTGPDGPPDADVVLKALVEAHDAGRLEGVTELRFTACDLASPIHEATIRTVMSGLWRHRAQAGSDPDPLTALAADAPVWSVPGGGLFTARHVGVTADGRVTVFGDGADWHRFHDTGAPDHTATSTPVGDDGAPADAARATSDDDPSYDGAVKFGDGDEDGNGDGEDSATSISMTVDGLPLLKQRTIEFRKGQKTLTEEDRTTLRDLAMELFPELLRRAEDPSSDKLRIHVTAGGNNLLPGAAKATGENRALNIAGALATAIRDVAHDLGAPEADAMAVFTRTSRGRDTTGLDTTHAMSTSELRRRATVSAQVQDASASHAKPMRTVRSNAAEVDLFRQLAGPQYTDRTPLSLDDLVGSRIYWKTTPAIPEDHNLVFHVETAAGDGSNRHHLDENLVIFAPGTRVRVVSFERMESGRSLVTLREVDPRDEEQPPEPPARDEPVIGIPGVSYEGPNRPFDSTLVHDKGEENGRAQNKGKNRKDESEGEGKGENAAKGHYKFRKPLYIHRGEVEVEMTEAGPHVRFYTAVTNQTELRINRDSGDVSSDRFKDIQQDPVTGDVVLATGPTMDGTLWTGIGTPSRAIAWAMKYKAETPKAINGQTPPRNKPLIRSYLVPLHIYRRITSTAVPEGDAHALGAPYRGSDSLDPRKLREPVDPSLLPEKLRAAEETYAKRWQGREGSTPQPIDGPTPLSNRTVNTDQPGERNQFGIRGEHLALLRESIVPGSLITYYENAADLSPEPSGSEHPLNGEPVHVDELRERLGIPAVGAPQLQESYNPWVQNEKHVNSPEKLKSISTVLRQHYATWQHSRQPAAQRMPSPLLDHDTAVLPYKVRIKNLRRFLEEHRAHLPEDAARMVDEDLLDTHDSDDMPPAERDAREAVEKFLKETALTWASHAEIGYLLALQHKEVKADRNISDAPVPHDFDDTRRRRKEEVHLQLQVGQDLTRLVEDGSSPHLVINRLIRDHPELAPLYSAICAPTEKYTFYQHAQMVLGQYLKLAHRDVDDSRRLVPVDSVAKAILFHDIEKANSKAMYGDGDDPDEEQEQGARKKGPRKKEQHDHESEHRGAVDVMSRYRHLWGDVDQNKEHANRYWAAVKMVDSDPFGFYYRGKHSTDAIVNRDDTFHWIVTMYLNMKDRSLVTSDGTTRSLAVLETDDTEGIRRLFHEFHQYYQADFSSYTVYSTYHDTPDPEQRHGSSRHMSPTAYEKKSGKETFTRQFLSDDGQRPLAPENPYGTGPRVTETAPVGGRSSLRFVFAEKYESMYGELAAMFDSHQSVLAHFQRVGGAHMRADAQMLGDTANARLEEPASEAARAGDGDNGSPDPSEDGDDIFAGLWGENDGSVSFGSDGTPAPTAPLSSAERLDELVAALTRSHQDNGTHHLVDPDTDPAEADRLRDAIGRFPHDVRFFSVASHIAGTDGAPTWRGQRVTAGELAIVLSRLADAGVWDTAKPLQFAACGLGGGLERSYAADTLRALRELRPELPLTVYAPRSTLWFVPSVTGPFSTDTTGPGHTAVAQKVVWGADGRPRLVPDHWVKLSLPVGEGAAVEATVLGAHMPPDGELPHDALPLTTPAPHGYLTAQHDDSGGLPEAVPLGTVDNGEGSSSQQPMTPSTPSAPSASEASTPPPPRPPWYVAHRALGDGRVTSVLDSARVAADLEAASTDLRHAGVGARTVAKIMGRLAPVLSSGDPDSWNDFLRNGLVFRANGKVVVVTAWPADLVHHAAQTQEGSTPYASRNQPVTNRTVSSGGNASAAGGVDVVMKLANAGNLTGVSPSVKFQAGTTYTAARTATADTQGAGRTVVKETHEFDGGVRVQVHVLDKDPQRERTVELGFSGPLRLAFPEGTGAAHDDSTWKVVDPAALKSVLSTVNAVAPGRLLGDLASTLDKAGFAPDVTAKFVSEVTREFFNEKAFTDGNQWWSTGSLTSRVFTAGGFTKKSLAGHFLVGAELTGLQRRGETSSPLRVREDFSDAFGVKSSSKFGDKTGLTVGSSALVTVSKYVVVPSLELAVNAARSHNFDVGGSDKSKAKLKHAEETQAEYRAVARFHVEFVSSSKRPPLSFDSTLEMALGVPASRAEDFETRLLGLGPARERFAPEPTLPEGTGPRPSSRLRTVGLAVRDLLRIARQEPSANRDVGAERPFPSGGMPDPAGLLKIAGRHPIEIMTPDGTLPAGAPWTSLRDRPGVSVVPEGRPYSAVNAIEDGPAFRYHVNAAGQVTAAQRLGTSTFTELFGPLERGADGIARLTEVSDAQPWLGFAVDDGSEAPPRVIGSSGPDGVRLVVHLGADGTLDVRGTLRHPVEQAVRNLAAIDEGAAAVPTRVYADIASELEDFAARRGPVEVRIDPGYAHAAELTARVHGSPGLHLRQGDDPRRPAAYLMEVTEIGGILGPFRQRDFGKDPLEPPALASRTGLGPGVVGELPGSRKVLEAARGWLRTHVEDSGLKRRLSEEEYAQFHRELTSAFGMPGMRARFAKLLGSGVPVVLTAGDQEIRLHLRTELRELRDISKESGLSLTRSVTHSTNQAVGVGDQVSFSVTGGGTLRVGTGEKSRVEVPGVKISGGAALSNVKDSVTTTVKASREQETSGEHTAFTYAAVHHLTATVHDGGGDLVSGSSLRVEGDDVSAVVRVGNDHLSDPATVHRISTGTVTVFPGADAPGWIDDPAVGEFALPRNGLGGIHPDFLGTRGLTSSASELVAEHGGGTPPSALDDEFGRHSGDTVGALRRGLTPEIEDVLTPHFLQSRFEQLFGADGAVFPLPSDPSGRAQALVVRLRLGTPVHEGTGTGTSLAYGAETGTKSVTARTGSYNVGLGLGLGGYASLDGASVAASGSADVTRTHTDVRTVASASTTTSTLTYKGTSHRYRADAYYQISHHTWRPDGRFSTSPSDHSTRTRHVKVDGGVELTVPDHQARALDMTVPGQPQPVAPPEPRSYLNADLAKAVSHVEKLDADSVLPEVRKLLGTLKGLPGGIGVGTPTDLWRGLASVFSAESLRADFAALSTTSVRQVIKLRQHGGGTRLVGVRVTAAVGDPTYVGPRDQVTLAMGDTGTRSTASASGVSDKVAGQVSVTVRGTDAEGMPRGGLKVGGGAETSVGRTGTDTTTERDQHSLEVTGTAQEFSYPVTYTVEVFDDAESHQTVEMARTALNAPAQWVDRATGGRAGRWFAEQWGGSWEKLFPSGHSPVATGTPPGGEARLLVPDHLTRPGVGLPAEAVQVTGHVRPNGPTAVPQQVKDLNGDLAPAMQALSLPGLDRVLPWLPAAASLPHRVAEGDTAAPRRGDLAPATLAGLRTDLLTTGRHLRANVRRLLDGGYTVPVAGGEEITVRLVVHQARHLASGEFDSNVETGVRERESERERERTTLGWSGSVTPDGRVHATDTGNPETPGVSHVATDLSGPLGIGGDRGNTLSTTRSETVDERDKKKGTQHYYEADVTWVLTGSRKTTVEVTVDGGLIGLLHDDAVDGLVRKHPGLFGQKPQPEPQAEAEAEVETEAQAETEDQAAAEDHDSVVPETESETEAAPEPETRPTEIPLPTITVTPPTDTPATASNLPATPPGPAYRLTDYEAAGTTPHARRAAGEALLEAFADDEGDPIALALNGPSRNAATFPAYRPVRPVETLQRPALQVSADHRFAVPDHEGGVRGFYATADVVEEARARLVPAAGARLDVDPEAYVRFTRDGVEHTLLRVTVQGGGALGSAPLVLAGDPEGHHIALSEDSRPGRRDADMRRAVDANLAHYGPELERVASELERTDPERTDPRTVLARALADLRRLREEGGSPAALARAEAEAARAFAAAPGGGYGSREDDWHVRLGPASGAVTLPSVDWSF